MKAPLDSPLSTSPRPETDQCGNSTASLRTEPFELPLALTLTNTD